MNTIEERIELTLRSIERNKNRKNRREKAEKKLAMLIHLMDEEDLYTEYELHHIEELYPEETGRINWSSWFRLVNEYRSKLENERSWKHELSLHNP